jgi:branched-chain amino acid transport system permease protein
MLTDWSRTRSRRRIAKIMDITVTLQAIYYGLITGVNYSLFAMGITLIFGVMFVVNMAHGELLMLGAMILYFLMSYLNVNYFIAALIAIVLVAAFGIVFNRVSVRPLLSKSPWTVLLATTGMSMVIMHTIIVIQGTSGHLIKAPFTGISYIGNVKVSTESLVILAVGAAIILGTYLFMQKSRLGKDTRATIQDRVGAQLCGVNISRVYDYTFVIGAGLAAIGGVAYSTLYFADPFMGQAMLIKGFAIVVVAGMGNFAGAAILGIVMGVAEAIFSQFVSTYFAGTFIFGLMVIGLLFKPQGLFNRTGR